MSGKMRKLLVPQYVRQFRCIGTNCEDTCCIGWQVAIDKDTFKRYRACTDKELRHQMEAKVTRQRTEPSNENYAKIKLNEDGSCPFLATDKLCIIQYKLGEGYLSHVCSTYPRLTNKVNGIVEKSLTMSCPEALRLALLNPELMEFDETEENTAACNMIGREFTTDAPNTIPVVRYFWQLRIFCISLLQNRSYRVWQRLTILGLFCRSLDQLLGDAKAHEIPGLIDTYLDYLNNDSFRCEMKNIPNAVTIQMKLMKELADTRLFQGIASKRFYECFGEFLAGIEYIAEDSKENIGQRYAAAYVQYYQPFMDEREYVLENYLVNYVFKSLFPLGQSKHVFDNYTMLVVHYALIKLFLIGMAGFHKENFGIEHVVKLIQSFSREIEHNYPFLKLILDLFRENGYNTMPYMAILIKN
ncbi:Flagellar biosynthetic protein FliU [Sporomusa ovata DSM 2662]|uniref:Lysine-N-methylase n=1 Tax=Sporomusa ovata TaxID=2378 RepID=A0A0U1KUR1_9FIRM|nr:flagellin lysine-N-methylase [Sporomusa ovata]EQB26354.1 flagellin lysine-N-methylase FliB [Sporomusa ovata DSM 2662]CQR70434.1 Lysine-N-methylase [Sporomusa ovata]